MNALIKITYGGDRPTVSGRELHEFLEVNSNYTTWFERMAEYGFTEGADFIPFSEESTGGRPSINHQLTIDMAKEISMIQRNEKGKQARQYFIAVENEYKALSSRPMSQLEIMRGMIDSQIQTEQRVTRLENKMQAAFEKPVVVDWCKWINGKINYIVERNLLNYQVYRGDLYKELEATAHCNLEARLTLKRKRMKEAGHKYAECQAVNKLHIIDEDPKLRAIFEGIVKREGARSA